MQITGIPIRSDVGSPNNNFGLISGSGATAQGGPTPDIAITKTAPATARAGSTFDYRITVRNRSSFAATNVEVTDLVPVQLTLVRIPAGATIRNGVVTWNVGTLAGGASKTLTMEVRVNPNVTGDDRQHGDGHGRQPAAAARHRTDDGRRARPGRADRGRDGLMGVTRRSRPAALAAAGLAAACAAVALTAAPASAGHGPAGHREPSHHHRGVDGAGAAAGAHPLGPARRGAQDLQALGHGALQRRLQRAAGARARARPSRTGSGTACA